MITSNITLGASGGTDYVVFANIAPGGSANVVSMLHLDGTDGATGAPTDTATGAGSWTRYDGGALSTTHKRFGTASWYGGLIYPNSGTHWTYGTGDFCLEMWIRPTASITNGSCLVDYRNTDALNDSKPYLYVTSGVLVYRVGGTDRITGSTSLALNTWQHVALCRASGTTRLFLDGAIEGTWADSTDYATTMDTRPIFLRNSAVDDGGWNTVYLDEIRNTKGAAQYTDTFTPFSAQFTATGGTPQEIELPAAGSNTGLYTVRNLHADTLTVVSAGGTIDGASSDTIATGVTVRYISYETNWHKL